MKDSESGNPTPSSGVSTTDDAREETKKISSEIHDIIALKGKTSEPGPSLSECGDNKDRDHFFQTYHPWSFTPSSGDQLDEAMKRLKEELPKGGWKIVSYGPDSSRNKNITLAADNNKKNFSVQITHMAKSKPPALWVEVVSGCYEVPEGQRVDTY